MKNNFSIIKFVMPVLLIALGVATYLTTLHGEFITIWDDNAYVEYNPLIRSLGWESIYNIFTMPHYTDYYPLQIFSYAIDYRLWGLDPFGFHFTSILTHIINSLLVYILFMHLIGKHTEIVSGIKELTAGFGALIFLLHPSNIESVAWISERKNLLSATFYILSFYCYSRYKLSGKRSLYDLSLATFLLALLSKSSVVILPILLLLYNYTFFTGTRKGGKRSLFFDIVPFFILAGIFSIITVLVHSAIGALYDYPAGRPLYTFFTMLKVLVLYIRNSLFPFNLSPFYTTIISESIFEPATLGSASVLILLLTYTIHLSYRFKLAFFCILLFLIPFLPVLHIFPIAVHMTDRYLYLPLIGFSLLVSLLLHKLITSFSLKGHGQQTVFYAYTLTSLLMLYQLSILTVKQGDVWQNGVTVWEKAFKENPKSATICMTLGVAYLQKRRHTDAFAHLSMALDLGLDTMNRKNVHHYRAMMFISNFDLLRAERELERLKALDPDFPMLYYDLSVLSTYKGDFENAAKSLQWFLDLYRPPFKNYEDPLVKEAEEVIKRLTEKVEGNRENKGSDHLYRPILLTPPNLIDRGRDK